MVANHPAQGLASLGRNGDSMLVHMSPHEVAGLQGLAMAHGGSLTINPDTGLPEAFSLGGFFSSFLPTIAGMAFAPETGGFSMAPLLAGAATGAGLAAVKGENPLFGGLMGGLGGYGGGQLGYSLGKAAGANAFTPLEGTMAKIGGEGAADAIGTNVLQYQAPGMGGLGFAAPSTLPEINAQNIINAAGQGAGSSASGASAFNPTEKLSQAFSGLKNISGMGDMAQPDAWKAFTGAGGTPMQLAMPVGGAVLGGLEPSDIYGEPIKPSDKDKYDPYATLNLSGDTGLRLYAQGGTVTTGGLSDLYSSTDMQTNPALSRDGYGIGRLDSLAREQSLNQAQTYGYADGGEVTDKDALNLNQIPSLNLGTTGNIYSIGPVSARDFKPNSNPPIMNEFLAYMINKGISDKRLRPMAQGGPVSFADGGDANKLTDEVAPDQALGLASIAPSTNPAASTQTMPTDQVQAAAATISGTPDSGGGSIIQQVATKLQQDPNYQPQNPIEAAIVKQIRGTDEQGQQQGLGSLGPAQPSQPMAPSYNASQPIGPTYYAGMNAPRGFAEGGETSDKKPVFESTPGFKNAMKMFTSPSLSIYDTMGSKLGKNMEIVPGVNNPVYFLTQAGQYAKSHPITSEGNWWKDYTSYLSNKLNPPTLESAPTSTGPTGPGYTEPLYPTGPDLAATAPTSYGTYAVALPKLAQGGYLDGQGDGMSDSIPATIEGKQPARLADGEFVVPADVVSHIGNGSSKAGSQRLYSMLDRVRKARTGTKKQGKQIKPEKYMPA